MNYKQLKLLLLKRFSIPKERPIKRAIRSFTIAERSVFYIFVFIFIYSGLALLFKVNASYLQEVPVSGSSLTEGVVGNPRFINPVLAISEADKNLSALIYSGLVRITPEGVVKNDLAESVHISDDGLTYTVVLRPNARFHDGTPVTAEDVLFTVQKVVDPIIKSPRRGNWDGVTVEKVDDHTVIFTLKKPFAPFIDNLTLGILPKHIWKNVSDDEFSFSQFNTVPIGTGPYEVHSVERNSGGIPDYYNLKSFNDRSGEIPYIRHLIFKFYPSEQALLSAYKDGDVENVGGLSSEVARALEIDGANIVYSPLPRIFGVFFNQSKSKVLIDKTVRTALDLAAPKEEIVTEVLHGYATPIDGPLSPGLYGWTGNRFISGMYNERFAEAEKLLTDNGWTKNESTGILEKKSKSGTLTLSFSISTGNAPELKAVAERLSLAWNALGAKVDVVVYESGELNQNVIRPREFEALLFGEVIGRDADVYPFWHSSQRNDPGLNIALYANSKVDKLLEDARTESDPIAREKLYKSFDQELRADMPAVFLYSPSYLYISSPKVKKVALGALSSPQDRFLGIRQWYVETDRVWKLFVN